MNILIIGAGFIGHTLAEAAGSIESISKIFIYDRHGERAEATAASIDKATVVGDIISCLDDVELAIEAASQNAVREFAEQILRHNVNLMMLSIGAIMEVEFRNRLRAIAGKNDVKIYLPSGAIGGVDYINAASSSNIGEVVLTTKKPPSHFGEVEFIREKGIDLDAIESPTVIFEGGAAEAVRHFPKNINVAATLALASGGLDNLKIKLIADPSIKRNQHTIEIKGEFGEASFVLSNLPSPKNPKTSYLAAISAVALLRKITSEFWIGT